MEPITIVVIAGILLGMAGLAQAKTDKKRKKVPVRVKKR